MNIKEKITDELNNLNQEQLSQIYLSIKQLNKSELITKKPLPRCAGIAESGIGNLSEKDEELLWQ
jgi:hypothetical protein